MASLPCIITGVSCKHCRTTFRQLFFGFPFISVELRGFSGETPNFFRSLFAIFPGELGKEQCRPRPPMGTSNPFLLRDEKKGLGIAWG